MFYDTYCSLCKKHGISPSAAAIEMGISKGTVSVWKNRGIMPQAQQLQKISDYFGVSVDYLLGKEIQTKKDPAENSGVTDEDIKFALFGGGDVTDEQFEEVKQFARFVRERDASKAAQQKN